MHAKNLVINQGCNWQTIKAVCEDFPELDTMSAFALIVKAINSVNGGALVIASQQEEVFRVLNFVSQKQAHSLK